MCGPTGVFLIFSLRHSGTMGSNLRFEFALYPNPNLPRGSGSGILLNLIPEPQVRNQVRTGFGRFGNRTAASLANGAQECVYLREIGARTPVGDLVDLRGVGDAAFRSADVAYNDYFASAE
jgi:hypothetical protein